MADRTRRTRVSGWLVLALVVAVAASFAALAALMWARSDRDDARQRKADVEAVLRGHAGTSDRLTATQVAIAGVRSQLSALPAESTRVADLSEQDAALVRAALDAGAKGDVQAYNEAVTKRNDLTPQVDAAVDKLRTDVNTVLEALATVTNRTIP